MGLYTEKWIEGIGSDDGPLAQAHPLSVFCHSSVLCLAQQDTIVTYQSTEFSSNCVSISSSIDESIYQYSNVFPNPSTTSFTLQLSTPPTTQTYFQLYDALGRPVKREEINAETTTLQRGNLPTGIYFWQLQQAGKILERGKLVME